MKTQIEVARSGKVTSQMRRIAKDEGLDPEYIRDGLASGTIVIPANANRTKTKLVGIGKGLRTKVNANIGTSVDHINLSQEIKKLGAAIEAGTDTIMDLSTGGDLSQIQKTILKASSVPVGTVPIYEAAVNVAKKKGAITKMTEEDIFGTIESQIKNGVDFLTIHCGVTLETLDRIKREGRLLDIVSRGAAFLVTWMIYNKKENLLYEGFDRLLDLVHKFDVTLSLGDGLRPGSLADSTDRAQIQELILLGELASRAKAKGVQVMIEGPGHIPINEIESNVVLQKKLTNEAPFYVLGPLVTDVAPGYDHIVAAIGGALAASYGADFLCYVTPSEHLRLPTISDVKEGVIATRIAAHAADIAKGVKGAMDWDIALSRARKKRDWKRQIELALEGERPRKFRKESHSRVTDVCTMCGKYCAIKLVEDFFKKR